MNPQPNQPGNSDASALHPATKALLLLKREINTYRRELPRLLAEGEEGRVVLIKGDQVSRFGTRPKTPIRLAAYCTALTFFSRNRSTLAI